MKKRLHFFCFVYCSLLLIFVPTAHATIIGSTLTTNDEYRPGDTNTFVFRCDAVSPDQEFIYSVAVDYLNNMNVLAGYKAIGSEYGYSFSYNGASGDGVVAQWNSDEEFGSGAGSLIPGEHTYFTNIVATSAALSGDITLPYYIHGDGYGNPPNSITNTLVIREWQPRVEFMKSPCVGAAYPGTTAEHTLQIYNNTGANDSFSLAYTSGTWGETGPAATSIISDKSIQEITVQVDVPLGILAGVASTTQVTVTGITDPSFTTSAYIITKCTWTDTIMSEPFNSTPSWPPSGWSSYNLGESAFGWSYSRFDGNPPQSLRHLERDSLCSNWFVSPAIDLQKYAEKLLVTFDESILSTSTYTYTGVMISDGARDPSAGDYTEMYEITPHNEGFYWSTREVDITQYQGENPVYLAFLYIGKNGHRIYIDNASVIARIYGIDNVTLIEQPAFNQYSYSNTPPVTAQITIAGETGTSGPANNITCQIGYGLENADLTRWEWFDAIYVSSDADSDYYTASLFPTAAGAQKYACRFRKGESDWLYGDTDGSTNGFDIHYAGDMILSMQPPSGELLYEQTLDLPAQHTYFAYSNTRYNVSVAIADDVVPEENMTLETIRWNGRYGYVRNNELGFMLTIYTNHPNKYSPGNILYQQFRPGYNCEIPTNISHYYSLELPAPVHLEGQKTYWISIQQVTSGEFWGICFSTDKTRGSEALVYAPAQGFSEFTPISEIQSSIGNSDLGLQLYGTKDENVYCIPREQNEYGRVDTTKTYTETIQNHTSLTNNYSLTYISDWAVSAPAQTGSLLPLAETNIVINISVPTLLAPGTVVTTKVIATGIDYPQYSNTCTIITETSWDEIFFCEEFEDNWLPDGWTQYQLNDVESGWEHHNPGADNYGFCAMHARYATNCNNWLVSPPITLPSGFISYTLSFFNLVNYTIYYDASTVLISTNSPNPVDGDYIELLDVGKTDTVWLPRDIDISAYEGHTVYIAFQYEGNAAHYWYIDDVCVSGYTPPPLGTITGCVTKAFNGDPIENATVTITAPGGYWMTNTAPDGTYFINSITGTVDITVHAENYETQTVADITLEENISRAQNVALVGSVLTYGAHNYYALMEIGEFITNTVYVTNSGPFDLTYKLHVNYLDEPQTALSSYGLDCYGADINNDVVISWNSTSPQNITTIGTSTNDIFGCAFLDNDKSVLYCVTRAGDLLAVNTSGGDHFKIGSLTILPGDSPTDITQDPTDGTVYLCTSDGLNSYLYSLNPATAQCTSIGYLSGVKFALSISINSKGEMYLLDGGNDQLMQVDKTTADVTPVGYVGYNVNYIQGMDFDQRDDTLYLAAYNASGLTPQLRIADVTTGTSTNIGTLGDGSGNISSIAIAQLFIPEWMNVTTNVFTCPAGDAMSFDVIYDSSSMYESEIYSAKCAFTGNFINDPEEMQFTIEIIPEPASSLFLLFAFLLIRKCRA